MLTFVTWFWGDKFSSDYVKILKSSIARNTKQPHRFLCVTDKGEIPGIETTILMDPGFAKMKGCFCRLRMFDTVWQRDVGINDRFISIDLDTVIVGDLDPLFDRKEDFLIMQGANSKNPCKFNGALMLITPGSHEEVWDDFTLQRAKDAPYHEFPDDQGWIWHKVPGAAGWKTGPEHGVYVYRKPGWDSGEALPDKARLVTFINKTPRDLIHLDWVRRHWH